MYIKSSLYKTFQIIFFHDHNKPLVIRNCRNSRRGRESELANVTSLVQKNPPMHLEAPHLTSPGPIIQQTPHSTNVKNCTSLPLVTTEAGIRGALGAGMTIILRTRGKGTEMLMSELKMLAELRSLSVGTQNRHPHGRICTRCSFTVLCFSWGLVRKGPPFYIIVSVVLEALIL